MLILVLIVRDRNVYTLLTLLVTQDVQKKPGNKRFLLLNIYKSFTLNGPRRNGVRNCIGTYRKKISNCLVYTKSSKNISTASNQTSKSSFKQKRGDDYVYKFKAYYSVSRCLHLISR